MCIYLNLMILIKIIRGFISAEQSFIRAVYGVGYRWEADACRIV
ncbi:hypothetical protein ECDEC7C_2514 [Escherichia coli DEC7C]|nr:hypothetical protein ECDEC7C_2514 [Escherichia coli DEC7C]